MFGEECDGRHCCYEVVTVKGQHKTFSRDTSLECGCTQSCSRHSFERVRWAESPTRDQRRKLVELQRLQPAAGVSEAATLVSYSVTN